MNSFDRLDDGFRWGRGEHVEILDELSELVASPTIAPMTNDDLFEAESFASRHGCPPLNTCSTESGQSETRQDELLAEIHRKESSVIDCRTLLNLAYSDERKCRLEREVEQLAKLKRDLKRIETYKQDLLNIFYGEKNQ